MHRQARCRGRKYEHGSTSHAELGSSLQRGGGRTPEVRGSYHHVSHGLLKCNVLRHDLCSTLSARWTPPAWWHCKSFARAAADYSTPNCSPRRGRLNDCIPTT